MSTPAPAPARATRPAAPPLHPVEPPAEWPRRRLRPATVLPVLFVVAFVAHALRSTFHLGPAIFMDELLHQGLAQSLAAGDGLSLRGETTFFPSPLPALAQAPAWLVGDVPTAYALAKVLNALVMSAAVFPAFWLARMLVRPSFALLAAGATVAAPAMLYSSYLLSEALAYPVFLATVGVLVRALARPSPLWGALVLAASAVAVGTRVQFAVLPLAFALLVLARPRDLRRHVVPLGGFAVAGAAVVLAGSGALGSYSGLGLVEVDLAAILKWAALTGVLLPFGAGLALFPGAALGLSLLALRPHDRAEAAFARLALLVSAAFLLQAGLIAADESARPLERYVIYLAPLLVVAFFAYVERGAPWRRGYVALAVVLGLAAWAVPFPTLADYRFSFDSPVLSAYGTLADWGGNANAATVFAGLPTLVAIALALTRLTHRTATFAATAAIAVLLGTGVVAAAGDHAMTERARTAWTPSQPDWLDELRAGRADFLGLPGGSPHFAWSLEAWNRDFGRPIWLREAPRIDTLPRSVADIAADGTLLVDGRPARAGLLVVNDFGTRAELEGEVVARPKAGLTLVRISDAPRVRSLARGLFHDGWANGDVRFRAWPEERAGGGTYRVVLGLPRGLEARDVRLSAPGERTRLVHLEPGERVDVRFRVGRSGAPPELRISSDRAQLVDGRTANPRLVSFRIELLTWEPAVRAAPSVRL
jgi:hypothetical protein